MSKKRSLTRRIFMIGSASIAGVAIAGVGIGTGYLASVDVDGLGASKNDTGSVDVTAWINIAPDNKVTIYVPFLEMGQGTHTGMGQLVAEELGIDIEAENVSVTHPSRELSAYANWTMFLNRRPEEEAGPVTWFSQRAIAAMRMVATGGSTAIVGNWSGVRQAGATARELLKAAAAQKLGVPADKLSQHHTEFSTPDGAQIVKFGDLAELALQQTPPTNIKLRGHEDFTVIGKSVPRLDIPEKVRGAARYGIDVRLPDMVFAALHQAPVFGAKIKKIDEGQARKRHGIIDIVNLETAVAVVADNTWRAKQAVEALDITYEWPAEFADSSKIKADLKSRIEAEDYTRTDSRRDIPLHFEQAAKTIEAVYETPYLAHATMEPMNTTVWWKEDDTVEVWSPTQSQTATRWAAEAAGSAKDVTVHVTYAGGGFGRRAETDFAIYAAKVAHALKGRPVQVIWSREEDMRHDDYRPGAIAKMSAGLDAAGKISVLKAEVGSQSVFASYLPRNLGMPAPASQDEATLEGILKSPYLPPAWQVSAVDVDTSIPVGFWRSVGHSNNSFFMECFADECATGAGLDPAQFKLANLPANSREARVLKLLMEKAGWTGPLGNGKGRGLAVHKSFRSVVGAVLDVSVDDEKTVTLEKAVMVCDCGTVINPRLVEAQMQGGLIFGLTAAAFGEITVEQGKVTQGNFDEYEMLKLASAPSIEVHLMPGTDLPGGVGEPGTPPAAPALANAIFAATGERIRTLPISKAGYSIAEA
ncbi:MAG: xanthine dehydrogenase family protein molybdopterin-binding subunit [Alphaproteobacteria bacterium]|nr:xanthine dehydrogenase family protein molybdopterin-binding subunit [Alphaproteobacteria bacterium]